MCVSVCLYVCYHSSGNIVQTRYIVLGFSGGVWKKNSVRKLFMLMNTRLLWQRPALLQRHLALCFDNRGVEMPNGELYATKAASYLNFHIFCVAILPVIHQRLGEGVSATNIRNHSIITALRCKWAE